MNEQKSERAIRVDIDIDASADAVWKALTEADELIRWFPLQATVEPGEGGAITMGWGERFGGTAQITAWEPGKLLRTTVDMPAPDGPPGSSVTLMQEYRLAEEGGRTLLRLVHSGFGEGDGWDGMVDGTKRGWDFELRGLRHYLERHAGTDRRVVWARRIVSGDLEDVWRSVMSERGLAGAGRIDGTREGERYEIPAAGGDPFAGTLYIHTPPFDFAGIVEGLGDAYLRVRLDAARVPEGGVDVNAWLSLYGLPESAAREQQERLDGMLTELFAD